MQFRITALILLLIMGTPYQELDAKEDTGNATEIPEAIQYFIEGLNSHSYTKAKAYISPNFEIEGVPQEYMKQALSQVFSSFSAEVTAQVYKSQRHGTNGLIYTIGVMINNQFRDVEFELDKKGKVLSCSIFRVMSPDHMQQNDNLTLNPYAELDFELVNGIIVIPARLNGQEAKFILDSGAPMLVINSAIDTTSGNVIATMAQGIGGNIQNMGYTTVRNFTWAGGTNLLFDTVSMDLSHLESELGMKFDGLISKAELEPFEAYIDYETKIIRLFLLDSNGKLTEPDKLPQPVKKIKFDLERHIACLDVKVGKTKMTMGLDTGAQTNLLDDDYFADFEKELKEVQSDTLRGADTSETAVKTGIIKNTAIGKAGFPDMIYVFSDVSELNRAYDLSIDGILGYPFLSKQPISLNYRKKTLSLY